MNGGQHTAWAGTSDRSRLNFFMCTDIGLGEVSAGTAMAGIMGLTAIPLASCATLCPLCIAPTNYKTPHRRLSARHHCSSRCLAIW